MTYFIDFDRTIFDTSAFLKYLEDVPGLAVLRDRLIQINSKDRGETISGGAERNGLWKDIGTLYREGVFSFNDNELAPFVFPDVLTFLDKHGTDSVVISRCPTGNELFQKAKVATSGIGRRVARVVILAGDGEGKGTCVQDLKKEYPAPYCFIDDLVAQVDSVVEASPDIQGYEMRRDTKAESGRYPVLRTLADFQ